MSERYDVVLYGATGFTGRQAAAYLTSRAPAGARIALAGRRAPALESLAAATGAAAVIVAPSDDGAALDALAARARVVASTAGPFARHGSLLVAACVRHGVDYADITGETPWVRAMIDRHHAAAARAGVRIVPGCGVDSVPADLGALLVVTELRRRHGVGTRRVSASFVMRGGLNGGTLASALGLQDPGARAAYADVLLLNPPDRAGPAERARSADRTGVSWDAVRGVWLSPYIMAATDTRVVRRSNALRAGWGEPYGAEFTFEEALEVRRRVTAHAVALGVRAAGALLTTGPGAWLARRLGPQPGEGPAETVMARGFLRVRLLGEAEDGGRVMATLAADGDPSNRITVTALAEAALALAGDRAALPGGAARGGVLTPATALGQPLLARLEAAGWRVRLDDVT
jgi:short subunit dehydrogenase-like uncharacterized protein